MLQINILLAAIYSWNFKNIFANRVKGKLFVHVFDLKPILAEV